MAATSGAVFSSSSAKSNALKGYQQPQPSFTKTEAFQNVLSSVQNKTNNVIHIYGLSGAGKSQIVSAVCREMDEQPIVSAVCREMDEQPNRIIWHVQCQPGGNRIMQGWIELINLLLRTGFINANHREMMENDLRNKQGNMRNFLEILNKIHIDAPILLAVEDVDMDLDKKLINNLIDCIRLIGNPSIKNIQLLIATREREVLFSEDDLERLDFYEMLPIPGFTINEAMEFLRDPKIGRGNERKVEKLAEELAYSPLGLSLAKSYCRKSDTSYEVYYNSLGKDDEIVNMEKEILKKDHDLRKNHRYEVVMKLIAPNGEADDKWHAQFKVMKMMSFLHNQDIPNKILETFFGYVSKNKEKRKHETSTKHLLGRLKTDLYAIMRNVSKTILATLHADILRAINVSMVECERRRVLCDVVLAFASLLDKDNRIHDSYALLYDLKDHAQNIINICADDNFQSVMIETNNYEALMGLSRINEVVGYAISEHPDLDTVEREDHHYQTAIDCIWKIVLKTYVEPVPSLRMETKSLIFYKEDKDACQTAERMLEIVEKVSMSNQQLKQALKKDWLRVFKVKQSDIADMKKRLGENCDIEWTGIEKEIEKNGDLLPRDRELLVAQNMIIDWDRLLGIYLAERIASILHSRGRQDELKGHDISKGKQRQCSWYADVGFYLCDKAFQRSGVKSSFHYIIRANSKLPRLARSYEGEKDSDFFFRFKQGREMVYALKNEMGDHHEHGIYKRIPDERWTSMHTSRFLVKVNTKVYKRLRLMNEIPMSNAKMTYLKDWYSNSKRENEELYEIALRNEEISKSTTSLVYVGKFYAAGGNFAKALEALEAAFSQGINQNLQINVATYSWALYNYGRVVLKAGNSLQEKDKYLRRFEQKYNLVEAEKTPPKLRKVLKECHDALQQMQTSIAYLAISTETCM